MSLELKDLSCFDSWEKSQLHLSEGHLIYYHSAVVEASVMARIISICCCCISDLFILFECGHSPILRLFIKRLLALFRQHARYWGDKCE